MVPDAITKSLASAYSGSKLVVHKVASISAKLASAIIGERAAERDTLAAEYDAAFTEFPMACDEAVAAATSAHDAFAIDIMVRASNVVMAVRLLDIATVPSVSDVVDMHKDGTTATSTRFKNSLARRA